MYFSGVHLRMFSVIYLGQLSSFMKKEEMKRQLAFLPNITIQFSVIYLAQLSSFLKRAAQLQNAVLYFPFF